MTLSPFLSWICEIKKKKNFVVIQYLGKGSFTNYVYKERNVNFYKVETANEGS